jgi:hypothetical protein
LKESEKGVSNLTCLPLDHETIVQIMQDEEDEEATKHTRTYTDLKKKMKNITHTPPSNYTELKLNVAMWAAMVWALFTETCPLYTQLMQLYMLLVSNYCDAIQKEFTGPVVRSVCWAIFEGSKEFFAQVMTPADFLPGAMVRKWPIACVSMIANDVKYAQLIGRPTYPEEWQAIDRMEDNSGAKWPGNTSGTAGGGKQGGTPRGNVLDTSKGNQYNFHDPRSQPSEGTGHVHPTVAKLLEPLWKLHGPQISVKRILMAGNVNWGALPYLHAMVQGNKNLLCYNFICGQCGFKDRCSFKHVPGSELVDDFAKELCQCLEPGVKQLVKQGPAPDKTGSGGDNGQGKGRGFSGSPHLGNKRRRGA